MNDPLRQAEAHLQRYWNIDGLHEIAAALILGLMAVWLWATDIAELPWKTSFSRGFPLLLLGGMWAEGAIVKAIRRRLTYPRAGFADLRRPSRQRQVIHGLMGAAIAAAIAINLARGSTGLRQWAIAGLGLICSVFLWQMGWRAHLPRFYCLAGLSIAAAIGIAWAGTPFSNALVLFWAICAAGFLISGTATLWRFLHSAPAAEE